MMLMPYNEMYQVLLTASAMSATFLVRTVPFMVAGVILADLIVALKFVDKIAFIARPISNFAHLRDECGASFMTAFISATSANSMLASFYNNKLIDKKELFIASMMTSFPAIVMHWRALLPILIPLLGVTGLIYFGVLMAIGLVKTTLIMLVGRFLLDKKDGTVSDYMKEKRPPIKDAFKISLQTSKKTVRRILCMTIPVTFLMFILMTAGAFDTIASHLQGISYYLPVPAAGLSIIAAQFASYVAAHATAGALLSEGTLTGKEVILTLLVGNVLSSVSMIWRWMIPYYVGIFGTTIGIQILAVATTIRTLVMLVVIFVIALFW